jgi:hypothetical protein
MPTAIPVKAFLLHHILQANCGSCSAACTAAACTRDIRTDTHFHSESLPQEPRPSPSISHVQLWPSCVSYTVLHVRTCQRNCVVARHSKSSAQSLCLTHAHVIQGVSTVSRCAMAALCQQALPKYVTTIRQAVPDQYNHHQTSHHQTSCI